MNSNAGSSTGERMQQCTPVHHAARVARSGLRVGADVLDGNRPAGAGTKTPVEAPAAGFRFFPVVVVRKAP